MIREEEARAKILGGIQNLPPRNVPVSNAIDCYSAEDLAARLSMPQFDNSAMDGYAVVAPVEGKLRVVGEQPAGLDNKLQVSLGQTVRIFTGAPIPAGANAVVMQEDVTRNGDEITVNDKVDIGDFIRKRGCDLAAGQKMVGAGDRITSQIAALLAAQGFAEVTVGGEPTAAVLSTGDELAPLGQELSPGQIYDSNSVLLEGLLRKAGAQVKSVEHCRDDFDLLCKAIKRGAEAHVLVVTGGVSVGEHDLVRKALESLGARIELWRVAVKPGKPFLFAQLPSLPGKARASLPAGENGENGGANGGDCFVFGLPGNPVSAYVTFFRFVRPAILKMMGARDWETQGFPARLGVDVVNDDPKRPHYVRGKFEDGTFTPTGRQESHALFGLSQSNAILHVPAGGAIRAGSSVDIEIWE